MVNLNNSKDKVKFNLFKIRKESLKTLTTIITIFVIFSTVFFGCKPKTAVIDVEKALEYPITVLDDTGYQVTLGKEPDKIISLAPGNTEILFALGLGEKVVGVDSFSNYPEEVESIEKIGDAINLNMEKIIELEPNLILTLKGNEEAVKEFEYFGIAVYTLDANNIENVLEDIIEIGKLTNSFTKAEELVSEMQGKIGKIKNLVADVSEEDKPKVFYMVENEPIWSTGSGTFINDMIEQANGINIVAYDDLEGWLVYSLEKLIEHNPDVIIAPKSLAPTPETITNDERFSSIKAALENRVVVVDGDLVTRIGPRIVEGLLQIAQALYPDIEFPE